jgi:hypothetical protein
MKAIATCPKCEKRLTTDCRGCIESGTDIHKCKNMKEPNLVEGINWKRIPETEKELNKIGEVA